VGGYQLVRPSPGQHVLSVPRGATGAPTRTFESYRRMAQPKPYLMARNAESAPFVPRTLPPLAAERPRSRAERERDAKAYWDSLSEAQEVWALRKMGYFKIGA
jgi:hypothetical protein